MGYLQHTPSFPVSEGAERFDTPWKGKPLSMGCRLLFGCMTKMSLYLDEMPDGFLLEAVWNSLEARADRLWGELRFCSAECGRINALTELSAGKRPVFVSGSSDLPKDRNYYTDQ